MAGRAQQRSILRGFVERVRLAVLLKRTRAARVLFALAVTLLLTGAATYGSWALGVFDEYDPDHPDLLGPRDHLEAAGATDHHADSAHDFDADPGRSSQRAHPPGSVVRKRGMRSPMFLGKAHQAVLFAAKVHGGDDHAENEEANEVGGGDGGSDGDGDGDSGNGGNGSDGGNGGNVSGIDSSAGGSREKRGGVGRGGAVKQRGCRTPKIRASIRSALRDVRVWRDAFGADVVKRYSWTTCAVVGNSGALLASTHGPAIDAHSAVFRLNAAPTTARLAQRVGKKTQLRLLNMAKAKAYLTSGCSRGLPCAPGSTLVAVRGTPFPLSTNMWVSAHASILAGHVPAPDVRVRTTLAARMNISAGAGSRTSEKVRPLGKVRAGQEIGVAKPPPNVLGAMKVLRQHYRDAYIQRCGAVEAGKFFKGPVTPSSGMFAIVIALSLCNTTSVFGFGTGARAGYQYFHGRQVQSSAHSFDTEKRIIGIMGKSGVVRVNGVVDREEEGKWRAMLRVDKAMPGALAADD